MKDVSEMANRFADDSAQKDKDNKDAAASSDDATQMEKPTASETTSPKKPRRKPAPSKKATKASVQADLDALESRLKQAEEVTQRSIGSLETDVSALEKNLKQSSTNQKGRLTRHVNELTERLDRQTAQMRSAVREELQAAIAEGGVGTVDQAIDRASSRLDKAEIEQADAIARVNKHLADIARAVDSRIKTESEARKAGIQALHETVTSSRTELLQRVETIEKDSATAFNTVGKTIEQLHEKLESRRKNSSDTVIEKINALAAQTKADLNTRESNLTARFEEIEARTLAVGRGAAERAVEKARADLDYQIKDLKGRLAELENKTAHAMKVDAPKAKSTPTITPVTPITPVSEPKSEPDFALAPLPPLPKAPTTPAPLPTPTVQEVQPPRPRGNNAAASAAQPAANPYAASLTSPDPVQPASPPLPPAPVLPFPGQTTDADAITPPPLPPFQMPKPPMPEAAPSTPGLQDDTFQTAPLPGAVYSDPAYAESESPMALRFIDDKPNRKFGLPSLGNRNLRIGLLAAGVAVVALMAGRMILGGSDITDPNVTGGGDGQAVVMSQPTTGTMPLTGVGPEAPSRNAQPFYGQPVSEGPDAQPVVIDPNSATTPIGDYVEQQPVILDSDNLDTLDAAVEAGNPIAQFQKGLAELDSGRTDEGAALIRQAANANQPAALYRLAKLYEAGEGVPRDDVMARQLIERAARGGNRIAMHDLALYYTEGRGGVDLDMTTAKSWFEQAARRGVVDSQFNLAILSESTETGTEPNLGEALFWYSVAAEQGDQFAVSRRDALRNSLDADRVDEIESRVSIFRPQEVDQEANGIFRDVPWVKSSETASRTQVREAQTLLASLGYPVGTPDGLMGQRTRNAIVEFERANGMVETGEVSGTLINRLSRAAGV